MAEVVFFHGPFFRQYGVATASAGQNSHLQLGIAGPTNNNLYTGALAAGDVKVSKDGGAEANIGTLPTQLGATGIWIFALSAAELTCSTLTIHVKKAATTAEHVITVENRLSIGPVDIGGAAGPANTLGLNITGTGTGNGLTISGGSTSGKGALIQGGASAGVGITIQAQGGANRAVEIIGAGSAPAMSITGGSAGRALSLDAGTGADAALAITGSTTGKGALITGGATSGAGLSIAGGGTGAGLTVAGGGTSGDGVQFSATSGHAISLTPLGAGKRGIEITPVASEIFFLRKATAAGGAAGTITLDGSASAVDSFYNECEVVIIGGTGVGQSRMISAYVGSTKVATVTRNWSTNPDGTSVFMILPGADIWDCLEGSEFTTAPADNATLRRILQYLKRWFTNKKTQTVTTQAHLKDDSTTQAYSQTVSDDGTTATVGKAT